MKHNNHCFHCGTPMPGDECTNILCLADIKTMPVWPWVRCNGQNCNVSAWSVMNAKKISRIMGLLISGIVALIVGIVTLSTVIQAIGCMLILGWFFDRIYCGFIRKSELDLLSAQKQRDDLQTQYGPGVIPDDPDEKKQLKDKCDKVKALEYKLNGNKIFQIVAIMITAFTILTICIVGFGPGDINPLSIENIMDRTSAKIIKLKNSDTVVRLTHDARRDLGWDNDKLLYIRYQLMDERGLSHEDYEKVTTHKNFNPDAVIQIFDQSMLNNTDLYNQIIEKLDKTEKSKPENQDKVLEKPIFKDKSRFQRTREKLWFTLLWIDLFVLIGIIAMVVFGSTSFIFQKAYMVSDELNDRIKLILEKREQNNRAENSSSDQNTGQSTQASDTTSSDASWGGSHILGSVIGSGLIEAIAVIITKFGRK